MKILLGSCLALMLVGAAPVIAADQISPPTNQNAPAASTQGNTDTQTGVQGPRHRHRAAQAGQTAGQHARPHRTRTFEVGQKVRPRFLQRHKLENYARFRLETPANGEQWVRARGQFILVSADGRVKDVIQHRHGHRNAGQHRHNRQQQQQNQTQDQPDSGDQQSQ